jgi:hypothetical protein
MSKKLKEESKGDEGVKEEDKGPDFLMKIAERQAYLESVLEGIKKQLEARESQPKPKKEEENVLTIEELVDHLINCPNCSTKLKGFIQANLPKPELPKPPEEKKEEVKKDEGKKAVKEERKFDLW